MNTKTPNAFPPPKTDKPRPHVCTTCQRSFARLEHLKRHERSHTKEKPFECPECTRCFARRDLLLRHQQKLHQTTTPSSRPRNRRESASSVTAGQSRARKNSVVGAGPGAAVGGASMRPRANTISHVDGAMMMAAANASMARGVPPVHSRHPSLVGLPLHALDPHAHAYHSMASAMGHRGMAHGLPKLETHGINVDFAGGLRTAPPLAVFSPDFDLESMFFGQGSTINPNALHYSDSPQSMAMDPTSPFSQGLHDLSGSHHMDDSLDWLTGFDHQMSFNGPHETAVDGSSPSAISTTSQSGMSDVMLDGSNHHPAVTSAAATTNMWPPAVMGPPLMPNPFGIDLHGNAGFPDIMHGAPVSPQPPVQKAMSEAFFSSPPPSLNSLSPTVMPGMNPSHLNHALGLGVGPETPTSMNGSSHGTSPISTITDSTRNAILGALSSAAAHSSPFGSRKFALGSPTSPHSPHGLALANGASDYQVPSTPDLQRYVGAYLNCFHPHLPFLHIPTLSFEMPAQAAHGHSTAVGGGACLILSMAAIGALYEMDHEQSRNLFELAKRMIQLYLDERRKANVRKADFRRPPISEHNPRQQDNSVDTPVWLVQAMLLNVVYGHNCGDRRASDIASTHCTALVSLAHGADLLRPVRMDPDESDVPMDGEGVWSDDAKRQSSREQSQWLRWKAAEERRRTLYTVFIMSSLLVSAYNHTPTLTNSEILLDLPCDEEFFTAPSAAAFMAKGGIAAANHNRMTFHEALGDLLDTSKKQQQQALNSGHQPFGSGVSLNDIPKSDLKPSTFGCLVLINALHNYIWETRQRHHSKVWTNEETEKMHRHIEPALRAWQAAWAGNPQHSLERPNPFGAGPLSADAIPLLDLAYIRLFVNLSRSKERFWQRDWDGLAEELCRGSEIVQHAEQSPASNAESAATDPSDNSVTSSVFVDSPPTQTSSPDFVAVKFPPAPTPNGAAPAPAPPQAQLSSRSISRREKHLRKAAFYAADSLSMSDRLGVTFADFTSRELPLQSAMCAFDCAQVLAEWVATLQDRVGRYLGVLGQDDVDLSQVPAIMLLEDEDVKLLGKIQEVLSSAEMKTNVELMNGRSGMPAQHAGYAAKILRVTAYMLGKAAVWPGECFSSLHPPRSPPYTDKQVVTHLMAECLENHACHMMARAEKSVMACE